MERRKGPFSPAQREGVRAEARGTAGTRVCCCCNRCTPEGTPRGCLEGGGTPCCPSLCACDYLRRGAFARRGTLVPCSALTRRGTFVHHGTFAHEWLQTSGAPFPSLSMHPLSQHLCPPSSLSTPCVCVCAYGGVRPVGCPPLCANSPLFPPHCPLPTLPPPSLASQPRPTPPTLWGWLPVPLPSPSQPMG